MYKENKAISIKGSENMKYIPCKISKIKLKYL